MQHGGLKQLHGVDDTAAEVQPRLGHQTCLVQRRVTGKRHPGVVTHWGGGRMGVSDINLYTVTCASGGTFISVACTKMLQIRYELSVEIVLLSLDTRKLLIYTRYDQSWSKG